MKHADTGSYEQPRILAVGRFAELTLGPNNDKLGDGVAFRGPDKVREFVPEDVPVEPPINPDNPLDDVVENPPPPPFS